ncbi:hypothetical protein ACFT5B_18305 [Luteimicrobium sp. NPDC057192]
MRYRLPTLGTLSQLRRLATHVEHVTVDDPRLDGVPDPRDVLELGH